MRVIFTVLVFLLISMDIGFAQIGRLQLSPYQE